MQWTLRQGSRYFLLFMAVSFLGWAAETVFFLLCYGRLCDRGFMTLPFCTIYGASFLLMDLLVGSAAGQGGLLRRQSKCAYFLLSALIPTGLELVTGFFFHRVFGVRLWSYSEYRFHFNGYICLEYTLLWGVLIPACMKYVFVPLKKCVFALGELPAGALSGTLTLLAVTDWAVNFSRQEFVLFPQK